MGGDNVDIDVRDLGFEGTRTEQATDRIGCRIMIAEALGFLPRCCQWSLEVLDGVRVYFINT